MGTTEISIINPRPKLFCHQIKKKCTLSPKLKHLLVRKKKFLSAEILGRFQTTRTMKYPIEQRLRRTETRRLLFNRIHYSECHVKQVSVLFQSLCEHNSMDDTNVI